MTGKGSRPDTPRTVASPSTPKGDTVNDCAWCGHRIPEDMDGEYCSPLCGLRAARANDEAE